MTAWQFVKQLPYSSPLVQRITRNQKKRGLYIQYTDDKYNMQAFQTFCA